MSHFPDLDAAIARVLESDPKDGRAYVIGVLAGVLTNPSVETISWARELAAQVMTSHADDREATS